MTSERLVKYLDMYLGVPSILIDNDTRRRKYYGKAGSFRTTPYGLEYRVLSGYMMSSVDNIRFVWRQLEKAIKAFNEDSPLLEENTIVRAINNSMVDLCYQIVKKFNICSLD